MLMVASIVDVWPFVSAPRCLISAFASASSINAAHLNEHSALVKIRKTEEAKKITLELR